MDLLQNIIKFSDYQLVQCNHCYITITNNNIIITEIYNLLKYNNLFL